MKEYLINFRDVSWAYIKAMPTCEKVAWVSVMVSAVLIYKGFL